MVNDSNQFTAESYFPKISIVIVTYNAGKTLQQCLDSIFEQEYSNIEIVIVDGNSTDNSIEIIKRNNSKIACWMSEEDAGVYDAMNKALKHITGDWVYFLGADDELLPDFTNFARCLADKTAIYYANVFADGAKRLGELSRYQFAKFGPYHQAMMFPKSVFDKYTYNTRYKISADFALTLTLCGDAEYHFIYKDFVIAKFNHTGLSGVTIDKPFQQGKAGLILKNFGLVTCARYILHRYKNRHNPRA